MTLRKALRLLCTGTALVCLTGGFSAAGLWPAAGLVLLPTLALALAGRLRWAWMPDAYLVTLALLAAVGLLTGAPAYLMVPGAVGALGAWDMTHLDGAMRSMGVSETARRFERKHIVSLARALGLGLLLAAGARLFTLDIPFVILLALVGLDLFSLDRVYRHVGNRRA